MRFRGDPGVFRRVSDGLRDDPRYSPLFRGLPGVFQRVLGGSMIEWGFVDVLVRLGSVLRGFREIPWVFREIAPRGFKGVPGVTGNVPGNFKDFLRCYQPPSGVFRGFQGHSKGFQMVTRDFREVSRGFRRLFCYILAKLWAFG